MDKSAGTPSSKGPVRRPDAPPDTRAGCLPVLAAGKPVRPVAVRLRDTTVLLVAVEGLVKELLLLLIGDRCSDVRDAASAARGLELFRKRRFDLVVVDEGLPDLNRAGFLADIRKNNTETAVVMFGKKLDGGASDPADIRADALIGLPLDTDRLFPLFCKAVNVRREVK
jgi:DNA-binding NtrC family response regulator